MKQLKFIKRTFERETYIFIFLLLVLLLILIPVFATFNDILTRIVMSLDAYKFIQDYVVPWEIRMVGVILLPFGFQPQIVGEYLSIGQGTPMLIELAWNCIGWQSFLFFILTAWVGLQGNKYSLRSKIKAWMIGFLGTFLVNLLRITAITLLAYFFGQKTAIIFHDYGSSAAFIGWLFVFWWFVTRFVLEDQFQSEEVTLVGN